MKQQWWLNQTADRQRTYAMLLQEDIKNEQKADRQAKDKMRSMLKMQMHEHKQQQQDNQEKNWMEHRMFMKSLSSFDRKMNHRISMTNQTLE